MGFAEDYASAVAQIDTLRDALDVQVERLGEYQRPVSDDDAEAAAAVVAAGGQFDGPAGLSAPTRQAEATATRQRINTAVTSAQPQILGLLDQAEAGALAEIGAYIRQPSLEARAGRAAGRVAALQAGGTGPGEALGRLTGAGDVDGVLALRESAHTFLTAANAPDDRATRLGGTADDLAAILAAIDDSLVGLVGDEHPLLRQALQVRADVPNQRDRLDAIALHATDPTPRSFLRRAVAEAEITGRTA